MGKVSVISSLMGSCARRESSENSVVVNTPVMEDASLSLANGTFDLVRRPTLSWAVEETSRRSWRFGAKSLSLRTE
jgi:hypothetical protein